MNELLPEGYADTLAELKEHVLTARFRAQQKANTELLMLWWRIGRTILDRQASQPWGSGVLVRLTEDLRTAFPTMKGFSRRNLMYMQAFARAWSTVDAIVQQPVAQLPWSHVIVLLDKLDDQSVRNWYAARDVAHGWSRALLSHHIATRLHHREAVAPTNFLARLEDPESELAQQITKDPYTLDFLAIESDASERRLEERLVDRIVDTLRELGPGFAFVGRQVHLEVEGDDFFIDLLFFHIPQLRYVVIEIKTTKFDPRDAGQLGFYVALVDGQLRDRALHNPTLGILLVAGKNDAVVRYALASSAQPIAVSRYELTAEDQAALPDEATLVGAFSREFSEAVADLEP